MAPVIEATATTATRRWASRPELDAICGGRLEGAVLDGLWVCGALDALRSPCIAIVGTRSPSEVARTRAHRLGYELSEAGARVVSGLGLGVDAAAHAGARDAGAPSIAVLGCGFAAVTQRRAIELADRIEAGGGAIVSPFDAQSPSEQWKLIASNGVIAALVDAVVFVEANYRSVAIGIASHAADRGTPVMAFPGDADNFKMGGCNSLIRDGATLVRMTNDVLTMLPVLPSPRAALAV